MAVESPGWDGPSGSEPRRFPGLVLESVFQTPPSADGHTDPPVQLLDEAKGLSGTEITHGFWMGSEQNSRVHQHGDIVRMGSSSRGPATLPPWRAVAGQCGLVRLRTKRKLPSSFVEMRLSSHSSRISRWVGRWCRGGWFILLCTVQTGLQKPSTAPVKCSPAELKTRSSPLRVGAAEVVGVC